MAEVLANGVDMDIAARTVAEGVVTEQHIVTLTRPDGVPASCDVCVVVRFDDDGLITRVDEYLGMAAFAPLFS